MGLVVLEAVFFNKEGWVNGLGQDRSLVLYNCSIFLYLRVCSSIVTHCSNSYGSSFVIFIDKKIIGMNI